MAKPSTIRLDWKRPTSIKVIDEGDRAYWRKDVDIKLSYQDGGENLRVFVWGRDERNRRFAQAAKVARFASVQLTGCAMAEIAHQIEEQESHQARLDALQEDLLTSATELAEKYDLDKDDLIWTFYDIASCLEG